MTLYRISNNLQDPNLNADIQALFDNVNSLEYIEFTVAVAGTEVAVSHNLEHTPRYFTHAGSQIANGTGVVYSGASAWTNKLAYLTATTAGTHAVILRR